MAGIFDLDVDVADGAPASGACTVVFGGLTLTCTVMRGAPWHGVFRARLAGGAGGWQTEIEPKGYRTPTGVRRSAVVQDAATACGETALVLTDAILGGHYAREGGPASRVLWELKTPWYMREDGVTVVGPRSTTPIASTFTVLDGSPERGIYTIATEKPEDFTPGRTFSSATIPTTTIRGVVHRVDGGSLRTEVWT